MPNARKGSVKKSSSSKTTKVVEQSVTFLTDPQIQFVSLVKHGANQEPFLVIKSRKGGSEDMSGRIVQRVIISKDLPEATAEEFLRHVKVNDEKEYDGFLAYDQVDKALCDPDSFTGMKLDAAGKVFAVTAKLLDDQILKSAEGIMDVENIVEVLS